MTEFILSFQHYDLSLHQLFPAHILVCSKNFHFYLSLHNHRNSHNHNRYNHNHLVASRKLYSLPAGVPLQIHNVIGFPTENKNTKGKAGDAMWINIFTHILYTYVSTSDSVTDVGKTYVNIGENGQSANFLQPCLS